MSESKHDAGDQHAGMVVVASLVEARADGTKVLESVDASFDYVASLVCLCIAGRRATSTRSFGQARLASILAFVGRSCGSHVGAAPDDTSVPRRPDRAADAAVAFARDHRA